MALLMEHALVYLMVPSLELRYSALATAVWMGPSSGKRTGLWLVVETTAFLSENLMAPYVAGR